MARVASILKFALALLMLGVVSFVACQPSRTAQTQAAQTQPAQTQAGPEASKTVFGTFETPAPSSTPASGPSTPAVPTAPLTSSRGTAPAPTYPSTSGSLVGSIYLLERQQFESATVNVVFDGYVPVGRVSTNRLDIPNRSFKEGFPGLTDRFEWFGIDYRGQCRFASGEHTFRLSSDDGSRLYIDDRLVIQNDGTHSEVSAAAKLKLEAGVHRVRVTYFQGPATEIALQFFVTNPGTSERIFICEQ
jgi:PA14 domain